MAASNDANFIQNFRILFLFLLMMNVKFSNQSLLSVNRRVDGDSFEVATAFSCENSICNKYNAKLTTSGLGSSCFCKCKSSLLNPVKTFYDRTSKCSDNSEITKNNACTMTAKDNTRTYSSLIALNASMTTPRELYLQDIPEKYKGFELSWFYYQNKKWHVGTEKVFNISTKSTILGGKKRILKISNNMPKAITGLLLKVVVQPTFPYLFNPSKCIMFKVLGKHKVIQTVPSPSTTTASTVATTTLPASTASPSTISPEVHTDEITYPVQQTTQTVSTNTTTTVPRKPKKDTSRDKKEILLIAFATGGVTLLVVLLLACVGICFFVRRQKRKKERKDTIQACTRPSLPRPPNNEPTSPPHDYEYVVYPGLDDTLPPFNGTNSLNNAMYGRGPDNELIIKTPTISVESLISKHTNNSTKSNHSTGSVPRDYAHLEANTTNDGNSIYQPLIRPHTPLNTNDGENTPLDTNDGENTPLDTNDSENVTDDAWNRPKTYMEPCNDEIPEYMELEAMPSEDTCV